MRMFRRRPREPTHKRLLIKADDVRVYGDNDLHLDSLRPGHIVINGHAVPEREIRRGWVDADDYPPAN